MSVSFTRTVDKNFFVVALAFDGAFLYLDNILCHVLSFLLYYTIFMIRQDLDNYDLPDAPGVYFWKDAHGKILYIGKATSLKDRVRSYFAPDLIKTRGPRLVDMVFKAKKIEWQETGSVLEALILEASLIKKHQPYYNSDEKDDKSWNMVVITKEEYPRVLLARQKGLDKKSMAAVFGPFPKSSSLKEALAIIRKIFPFRDRASAMKDKEAFYRQLGLSPDVRTSEAAKVYRKTIGRIKLMLSGKFGALKAALTKEMNAAAKAQRFEEAAQLREKLFALEHIKDVSLIKREHTQVRGDFRIESYDIAHISGKQMVGVMTVIEGDRAEKSEYRKFIVRGFEKSNDAGALREVLTRRLAHPEWPYPQLIVVDGNAIQINATKEVLKKVQLDIPIVSVTKDERHKPKSLSGDKALIAAHKYSILLANHEAHRFSVTFHRTRRAKAALK